MSAVVGVARFWLTGLALCAADVAGLALDGVNRLRPAPRTVRVILRADEDHWTDGT